MDFFKNDLEDRDFFRIFLFLFLTYFNSVNLYFGLLYIWDYIMNTRYVLKKV